MQHLLLIQYGLLFGPRLCWVYESGGNLELPLRPRASMTYYQSTGAQRVYFKA
jgi:hypothetical protein